MCKLCKCASRLPENSKEEEEVKPDQTFFTYHITDVHVNAFARLSQLPDYSQLWDYCVHVNTLIENQVCEGRWTSLQIVLTILRQLLEI